MTDSEEKAPGDRAIPLVVIGASAGGLVPLERFFAHAPDSAGWCFVVIQHPSPDHRPITDAWLARKTRLAIRHIEDGAEIAPDTIFLNRPDTRADLQGDVFRTAPHAPEDPVPYRPIDTMVASLAPRAGGKTAAVILSGAGRDGAQGAQVFHAAGGVLVVQDPAEADFPSMPQAILTLGIHDRVAGAAEIPQAIHEIFGAIPKPAPEARPGTEDIFLAILRLLERQRHLDVSACKETDLQHRIIRRQHLRGIEDPAGYLALLRSSPEAVNELYHDLLVGVTGFYRDPEAIARLRETALAPFAADLGTETPVRVWVAGCAGGEEAYTIAIELAEALRATGNPRGFRIIATDGHQPSIERASNGTYPAAALRKIPKPLRQRYFERRGEDYTIGASLRQRMIFSVHDTLTDPPFLDLDLVSCRTFLIYLREKAQARVISMFLFGLRKHGVLLLGPSETPGQFADDFETLDGRWRLFRKTSGPRVLAREGLPRRLTRRVPGDEAPGVPRGQAAPTLSRRASAGPGDYAEHRGREALIRTTEHLLETYAPSSIIVSSDGEVLAWFGAAGALVDTPNDLTEWSVEHILHRDLHFLINRALEKLRGGAMVPFSRRVTVDLNEGRQQGVTLHFEPLDRHREPLLLLIRVRLEAGGEEAHAVDEARVTVSAGHEEQPAELSRLHTETESLLTILDIGLLVVDARLNIRRFSNHVARWFLLEKPDVGRSLSVAGPKLSFVDLPAEVTRAIEDGAVFSGQGMTDSGPLSLEIHPIADQRHGGQPDAAFVIFRRPTR
ncbi:CheR family methyltransferase [Pararhodobacter aggregans]|uniref:Histidine kinase n=1 Tax=Pararhodobacter aggregans TaxID=404875 RepID=A0A2T7UQL5_9RHOB|nr:CheR family methyltransferase [Pararhodobacter aggregans]PTX01714.1 chemotaxis methyl-accepting protein methylase [Pararhodobacter aggregans]PVE46962.1 histidine kinase [Pararhodobacter aggregans]